MPEARFWGVLRPHLYLYEPISEFRSHQSRALLVRKSRSRLNVSSHRQACVPSARSWDALWPEAVKGSREPITDRAAPGSVSRPTVPIGPQRFNTMARSSAITSAVIILSHLAAKAPIEKRLKQRKDVKCLTLTSIPIDSQHVPMIPP
jgi:hypothetical protein